MKLKGILQNASRSMCFKAQIQVRSARGEAVKPLVG
jgi:hypothetical protein